MKEYYQILVNDGPVVNIIPTEFYRLRELYILNKIHINEEWFITTDIYGADVVIRISSINMITQYNDEIKEKYKEDHYSYE